MEGTSYRPILPDEATAAEICSGNRVGYPEATLQQQRHRSIRPNNSARQQQAQPAQPAQPAKKVDAKDGPKKPVVLSNNKVLTIGLLIIVVILIIIIVIQIMRSRKMCEENEEHTKTTHTEPNNTRPPTSAKQQTPNINDNLLKQYMKKKPIELRKKMSAMASYVTGRKENDDIKRMETIVENASQTTDSEHSAMRDNINSILQEQHDDDELTAMQDGSEQLVSADETVHNEIARQKHSFRQQVRDEALVTQDDDDDADGGAIVEEMYDDDEIPLGVCNFILVSGKRQGQQCGRKCADETNKCIRHHGK